MTTQFDPTQFSRLELLQELKKRLAERQRLNDLTFRWGSLCQSAARLAMLVAVEDKGLAAWLTDLSAKAGKKAQVSRIEQRENELTVHSIEWTLYDGDAKMTWQEMRDEAVKERNTI